MRPALNQARRLAGQAALIALTACAPLAVPSATAPPASTATLWPTLPPTATRPLLASPTALPSPTPTPAPAGPTFSLTTLQMWTAVDGWGLAAVGPADGARSLLVTADGGLTWHDRTPPDPLAERTGYALSVFFLDAARGWAAYFDTIYSGVDAPARIWRTVDGGHSWAESAEPAPAAGGDWGELQFVSPEQGWLTVLSPGMAVHGIALYGTQDGGRTWTPLGSPVTPGVGNMLEESCYKARPTFVDAATGWITAACENSAYVFFKRTADGGQTWTPVDLPAPADTPSLFSGQCWGTDLSVPVFFTAGRGALLAGCDAGPEQAPARWLYTTADGGVRWPAQRLPAAYGELTWAGPDHGWFLGRATYWFEDRQQLYRTTDGGRTWTELGPVAWQGRPSFVDANQGWAAAAGAAGPELLQTADGGQTWQTLAPRFDP